MMPGTSARNFTPNSAGLSGPESTTPGTVVLGQMVYSTVGAAMVMLKALVAVCTGLLESVTWTVKLKVPAAVGVPEMTPLLLSVNPVGSVPLAIDQVYGEVPPLGHQGCRVGHVLRPVGQRTRGDGQSRR